jgi:uncharacterized protein YndB with AHSA1/START domain
MNKPGTLSKETDGFRVVFERMFNHPVEKVWQAITDPEELAYWFTDISFDLVPGSRITFAFRDKDATKSYGEIVSIEPPHRFCWTWEGELAEWELTDAGNQSTRLVFTYSKISADYAVNVSEGFHDLLNLLATRLDGSTERHPFGAQQHDPALDPVKITYAASVYGKYPELVKHEPVVVENEVNAPVEKVWKALTEKEQMKQWYFDLDAFKAEEGFRFSFPGQGQKGETYIHLCTITEVIPLQKLQYSWQYEGIPGYSLVTFELVDKGARTFVKLTHHGLETFPQDQADFARSSFNGGWNELIGKLLPGFVEKN